MKDLSASPIGRTVVLTGHDHRFGIDYEVDSYIPDPLPTDVGLGSRTWSLVADAMASIGRLDTAARLLPNLQLLVRVATRLEAVGTAALEGTFANLTEVFAAELEPTAESIPARVREVLNFLEAVDIGSRWIQHGPITKALMSEMQAALVNDTESDGPSAGKVRDDRVFIGPRHRPITEARFVPPPPGPELEGLYDEWFDWTRDDRNQPDLQIVVRVAIAHYQFETIHPYHDGNGRVGRLAAALQFVREGLLPAPVLFLSPWLKEHEDEYKDHLLQLSATGEWEPWIGFFAEAIIASTQAAQARINRLLALQEKLSAEVRSTLPKGRLSVDIVDSLVEFPVITVAWAEKRFGKTNEAARQAMAQLVSHGFLQPYDDAVYDKRYWNPRIFQAIAR